MKEKTSTCCGADILEDTDICSKCGKHGKEDLKVQKLIKKVRDNLPNVIYVETKENE